MKTIDKLIRKLFPINCIKVTITGIVLISTSPVIAQTISTSDDGTVLKEIIFFGRHSIRAPVSTTAEMAPYAAEPYPDFIDAGAGIVPNGHLTLHGKQAAALLGTYFREYLIHENLMDGSTNDLNHIYFRANVIERSYTTAARFGEGLIPNAEIPIHTYDPEETHSDPVIDPLLAMQAPVDAARALAEAQGIYGSGTNIAAAFSDNLSLIRKALYPEGTQPTNTPPNAGSIDPTASLAALQTNAPLYYYATNEPVYYTGNIVSLDGLNPLVTAADPFVMQYTDGFSTDEVAWGRLTADEVSQQTRLSILQIEIAMRLPYLAQIQSSSAASHILRTLLQSVNGETLNGAFGDSQTKIHVIVSSDYYVAGLAGFLKAHWLLPTYQTDFCAPGGALIFELRQNVETEEYLVRVYYTAQTFDQLRNQTALTLENPPATMQLLIPGCSSPTDNLDISFNSFSNLLSQAIDTDYVQSFDEEVPPDVIDNPYIATTPTDISLNVSGNSLSVSWPADHLGWVLQSTTNSLSSPTWVDIPGTPDLTSTPVATDPAISSMFYRLSRE